MERQATEQTRKQGIGGGLTQIYAQMSPFRRRQFYRLIALMTAGAFAELATIGSVVPFLSLLANPGSLDKFRWLDFAAGLGLGRLAAGGLLFAILAIVAGAIRLRLAWAVQNFSYRLGHEIMIEIQRRVLLQPYSFHLEQNTSTLLAAIEKVEVLVFDVILPSMHALVGAFLSIFIVAALIMVDPFTALVAATASAAVYVAVSAFARKRLAANSDAMGRSFNERMKISQESLGSIRDVIIDGSQDVYSELFRRIDLRLSSARANTAFIASAPRYIIETVGIVIIAAIAVVVAQRNGGLASSLPILGAIAFGAQRLLPLLQQVYNGWSTASGYFSVVGQTAELLALPLQKDRSGPKPGTALPLRKSIRIDDVSFTYPSRRKPALAGISFEIPAGTTVALIGETGSGKSTLADLLMGLLQPDEGAIFVDGTQLTASNRRRWQRSIAHVPQSIFLADTTIARNIALALGDESPDPRRIEEAGRVARLDEFVATLPEGYNTIIGERGIRLSGGQRQRLGIARAVYKRAPVLVLDEATSALDEPMEQSVFEGLEALRRKGRTLIVIAHRPSTIARCDSVVRLHHGRVVPAGPKARRKRG
jgi:ATP-binding cassette subfamily B protein